MEDHIGTMDFESELLSSAPCVPLSLPLFTDCQPATQTRKCVCVDQIGRIAQSLSLTSPHTENVPMQGIAYAMLLGYIVGGAPFPLD